MIVTIAPCHLRHPSKPLYAGHSPAQLVTITGYDPSVRPETFARNIARALADIRFGCSAVVVRVMIQSGSVVPERHQATIVRAIKKRNDYGPTQKILLQRATPARRQPCRILLNGWGGYPWDTVWSTKVPTSAIRPSKSPRSRPPAVSRRVFGMLQRMRTAIVVKRTLIVVAIISLGLLIYQSRFIGLEPFDDSPYTPTGPPAIFSQSETVRPGEVFNLVAGNLPIENDQVEVTLTYLKRSGEPGRTDTLTKESYSQNLIQLRAPTDFPFGVWRVRITTPLGQDETFINQPRAMSVETDRIVQGEVFRIWGRNLAFTEWLPQIPPQAWLVSDQTRLPLTVLAADRYSLSLRLASSPSVDQTYTVTVHNGYGGSFGETTSEFSITSIPRTLDSLGLGIPWAHKLTFTDNIYNVLTDPRLTTKAVADGSTDDTAAIQAAIDLAYTSGGGVVYLPAGHYLVDSGVVLRSRTVLQGAGSGQTRVDFNRTYHFAKGLANFSESANLSGISGITANNLNQSEQSNGTIGAHTSGTSSELFLHDFVLDYGSGRTVSLTNVRSPAIIDSVFRSTRLDSAPIYTNGSDWITFRGNTIEYRCCRVHFVYNKNGIIENNSFILDSAYALIGTEKGALELSYSENLIVTGNTVKTVGDQFLGLINEQEMMLTQGGGDHSNHAFGFGSVTSASSTTLHDSQTDFANMGPLTEKNVVVITSGNGAGQWRFIASRSGDTLTIDRPWDVVPSSGAQYNVQTWTAYRLQIVGNTFRDTKMAVNFYSGGWDNLVAKNVSEDGGYFTFGGRDVSPASGQGARVYSEILWKTLVTDNRVANPKQRRRSFIDFYAHQFDAHNRERTVFNNEVRDNTVVAAHPDPTNPLFDYDPGHERNVREGFTVLFDWRHPDKILNLPTISGLVIQNNRAENFGADDPYYVDTTAVAQVFVSFAPLPNFELPNDGPSGLPDGLGASDPNPKEDQGQENPQPPVPDRSQQSSQRGSTQSSGSEQIPANDPGEQSSADESQGNSSDLDLPELSATAEPTANDGARQYYLLVIGLLILGLAGLGYLRWRYQLYRHRD